MSYYVPHQWLSYGNSLRLRRDKSNKCAAYCPVNKECTVIYENGECLLSIPYEEDAYTYFCPVGYARDSHNNSSVCQPLDSVFDLVDDVGNYERIGGLCAHC